MKTPTERRLRTIAWGAVPIVVLAAAVSLDHVPGTDISLTVPYAAEGPGPTVDTLGQVEGVEVVDIEGAKELDDPAGQLNMTTVALRTNMTLAQALGRWITTDDTLVPIDTVIPQNQTPEEVQERNTQAFVQSESAATTAAMEHLGLPVHVVVAGIVEGSPAAGKLEEGDIIRAIDGAKVDQPQQAQDLIQKKQPGDTVRLEVERPSGDAAPREVEVTLGAHPDRDGVPLLGILMSSAPDNDITVTYNLQDVGGPSAGMMFSLAVIDKLSPGDLTGGHFVAGTGTIGEDGAVGPIGGIVHKVHAARDAGAELFLAPEANCAEAISRDTGEMTVAAVRNLDDALAAMEAFAAGEPVRTCTAD